MGMGLIRSFNIEVGLIRRCDIEEVGLIHTIHIIHIIHLYLRVPGDKPPHAASALTHFSPCIICIGVVSVFS
jgi:hypothetical protein